MPSIDLMHAGLEKIDRDLTFVLGCFAEVLRDLGAGDLADHLPWVGTPDAVAAAPADTPRRLAQAFSIAFQLLNMVEENAAAQTRRLREMSLGLAGEHGLWGDQLQRLVQAGLTPEQIAAALPEIRVEPVLTAHPTEAKPATVLALHRALYLLLVKRENQMWTPAEQQAIRDEIRVLLERLWRTGEIPTTKPGLTAERQIVLHYLREVFPEVLPRLDQRLHQAWHAAGFEPALLDTARGPRLRLGSWVGGDRDGHPLVTAEVTAETLAELRANALRLLDRRLAALADTLTLSAQLQAPPAELHALIGDLCERLGSAADALAHRHRDEPWRQAAALIRARLPLQPATGAYARADDLWADLGRLADSLLQVGAARIAQHEVHPLMRVVEVFGFHLAALDIRQNSRFHDLAMGQLMRAAGLPNGDFVEWSEHRRVQFLTDELQYPRPFAHPRTRIGPEADAVLSCYRHLAEHLDQHGPDGLGSLIVSMTRNLSDLLVVYVLAREAGLAQNTPEGLVCRLPVVPLFETQEDLVAAPGILKAFLAHPVTRRTLALHRRGAMPVQQVMIGYSDSNKDSGILASQWALHTAQQTLVEVGRQAGVQIRFFHGRGGTISRGAGPTHRFLDNLPVGSVAGDLRLTEQGETIAQKYANLITATYNLELLLAGTTAVTLRHRHAPAQAEPPTTVLDRLSERSREAYQALIQTEGFLPFFRAVTPIDALEVSRIGSRPSRRTGQASLADLRAIPWVFSWTQARFYLPGWYGVGSALDWLAQHDPAGFRQLQEHQAHWPFLLYTLTNVETNLASADLDLMRAYAELCPDAALRSAFYGRIAEEYDRTRRRLEEVFGTPLGQRRPRMFKTLVVRADALRVLHRQQIDLLRTWRAAGASDPAAADRLLPDVLLSINAIASGLRTTG